MRYFLLLCWVLLMAFATAQREQPPVLEGDGWSARYRAGQGVELRLRGAQVGYASSLQIAKPDWSAGYYSSNSTPARVSVPYNMLILLHTPGERGEATEIVRLIDPQTLEWSLEIRWNGETPAIAEWCIGLWKTDLLQGATLAGEGELATEQMTPKPITREGDILFRGKKLVVDSRLARIEIQAEGDTPFVVLDGRGNPNRAWSQEIPSLWLGVLAAPLSKGKTLTLRYRMKIEAKPLPGTERTVEARLPLIEETSERWKPTPEAPLLIPPPKVMWWGQGEPFRLPAARPVRILIESDAYRPCADALQRELTRYGMRATVKTSPKPQRGAVFIGGSPALQRRYPVPAQPGAYSLRVEPTAIAIVGNGVEGAFYGVQTLTQWLQPTENALQALPVQIVDYPHLRFRGVHLFPSTDPDFLPKLIQNVIAPLKFNHLIIECGYAQWEAIRPAWVEFSAPKPLLKQAVETARAHMLEPIPLIQSLGHMRWVFRNGAFRELAEDPDTPWAIAPRRPEARALLETVYDEAFEVFQPRAFHIGMDEVTMRGRFPYSPESKGASVAELFVEQTRWAYEALTRRGAQKVMMWSDMLLASGEAHDGSANAPSPDDARWMRAQLSSLPNLTLCDWHYTPTQPENYKSVPILQSAGFKEIIATTWFNPQNIYTFARAARERRVAGLLQSTWAGYTLNENTLRKTEYQQFVAYAYAGLYAWDTDQPAPRDLPYDMEAVFARLYRREPVPLQPKAGFLVDLSALGNYPLSDWLDTLSETLVGKTRLRGHLFAIAPRALMLGGYLAPLSDAPRVVRLTIDRPVRRLYFLHTCAFPTEMNAEVARYRFEYDDSTVVEQPLLYGVHLRAWNENGFAFEGAPLWSQPLGDGRWAKLRLMVWQNPHPEKRLRTLQIQATDPVASLILVALSGE